MRITIFGPTGGVGRHLVQQAIERGHVVRAVARRPEGAAAGVEWVVAEDITSREVVSKAVRDAEAVLSAVGLRRRSPSNPWSTITSPTNLTSLLAERLVEALAGTPARLIAVSAAGVGDSRARMSPVLRFMFDHSNIGVAYRDLERMEDVLTRSSLNWVAVRPTTLNNRHRSDRVREVERYGLTHGIARADVAWWMLESLGLINPTNRTPMIANG